MSVISQIEDALLAKAELLLEDKVRVFESLPGGWTMDMLTRALQKAPGVYVAFQGLRESSHRQMFDGRFTLYCVTKGADELARRRGNSRVIGSYDMVCILAPVFARFTIDEIGTSRVRGVDNLFRDAMFDLGGTVYGIQIEVPHLSLSELDDGADLNDFESLLIQYDIDTDQEEEPLAEDNIDLPQE